MGVSGLAAIKAATTLLREQPLAVTNYSIGWPFPTRSTRVPSVTCMHKRLTLYTTRALPEILPALSVSWNFWSCGICCYVGELYDVPMCNRVVMCDKEERSCHEAICDHPATWDHKAMCDVTKMCANAEMCDDD